MVESGASNCYTYFTFFFLKEVQQRETLANNKNGDYISINVLEMVFVIIIFAAAIHYCHVERIDMTNHPVFLS